MIEPRGLGKPSIVRRLVQAACLAVLVASGCEPEPVHARKPPSVDVYLSDLQSQVDVLEARVDSIQGRTACSLPDGYYEQQTVQDSSHSSR